MQLGINCYFDGILIGKPVFNGLYYFIAYYNKYAKRMYNSMIPKSRVIFLFSKVNPFSHSGQCMGPPSKISILV